MALVDSRATRNFVSKEFVEITRIPTKQKKYPQIVQTIEGNNFQELVTKEVEAALILLGWQGKITFDVVQLSDK
jgi:hypothetical protein